MHKFKRNAFELKKKKSFQTPVEGRNLNTERQVWRTRRTEMKSGRRV